MLYKCYFVDFVFIVIWKVNMIKKKRKKKIFIRNRFLIFNVYNYCKIFNIYDILYKYFKYFKMLFFLVIFY